MSSCLNLKQSRVVAGQRGGIASFLVFLVVAGTLFVSCFWFIFGQVVPPNYIGLRQNYFTIFGVEKGYALKGLAPGLHWRIPQISDVILVPRGFQFVNFKQRALGGDLEVGRNLEVPTSDGSKIRADVTLVARFFESPGQGSEIKDTAAQRSDANSEKDIPFLEYHEREHGGPRELVERFKETQFAQLSRLADKSENELKKVLGALSTTDFYNPVLREDASIQATTRINELVNELGIELWATLIRRYSYAEKNIDDQIFAKNLQDQKERLNAASNKLAAAKAETEQKRAFWDAEIKVLEEKGLARAHVVESEGRLAEAKKQGEGDLLVAAAVADVDQAKAKALNEIPGADIYVARELAPLLTTLKGGVVTDIDPYDLDEWVRKLTSSNR